MADLVPGTRIAGITSPNHVGIVFRRIAVLHCPALAGEKPRPEVVFAPDLLTPDLKRMNFEHVPPKLLKQRRRSDREAILSQYRVAIKDPNAEFLSSWEGVSQNVTSIMLSARLRWKMNKREIPGENISTLLFKIFSYGERLMIAYSEPSVFPFVPKIEEDRMDAIEDILAQRYALMEAQIAESALKRMELDREALAHPVGRFGAGGR